MAATATAKSVLHKEWYDAVSAAYEAGDLAARGSRPTPMSVGTPMTRSGRCSAVTVVASTERAGVLRRRGRVRVRVGHGLRSDGVPELAHGSRQVGVPGGSGDPALRG